MKRFADVVGLLGVLLLALNVTGLLVPNDQRSLFDERVTGHEQALSDLDTAWSRHGASPAFLRESVAIVDRSTVYRWIGWKSVSAQAVGHVPLRQNWILWTMRWADPWLVRSGLTDVEDLFGEYQFLDYDKALRRGFGICSQLAILNADLLTRRYGIPTRVVGLDGHVVAQAHLDGKDYLLDPSAGVFLDFGLDQAEQRLAEVAAAYPAGSALALRYDAPGNEVIAVPGGQGYRPRIYYLEHLSEIAKWAIPLLALVAWLLVRRPFRRRRVGSDPGA